jgi:hypothetical protein
MKLRELYWFMYHEKPETLDGSHVAEMWEAGDLDGIAKHCEEDCRRCARIFKDLVMR